MKKRKKKSKDIALLTKVHLVKAIIFPVVMEGCENWIIKKAEPLRTEPLNCGAGENMSLGHKEDPTSQP